MTPPARAVWRFLRREGGDYVFVQVVARWDRYRLPTERVWARVPVERFWGGAQ